MLQKMLQLHQEMISLTTEFEGTSYNYSQVCYKPLQSRNTFASAGFLPLPINCQISSILALYGYNATLIDIIPDVTMPLANVPRAILNNVVTGATFVNNSIKTAKGFMTVITTSNSDSGAERSQEWELEYLDLMKNYRDKHTELEVAYVAERSLNDEIQASVLADLHLYAIGGALMCVYMAIALGQMNRLTARPYLAVSGVICVLMGAVSGFGFASGIGIPFYSVRTYDE